MLRFANDLRVYYLYREPVDFPKPVTIGIDEPRVGHLRVTIASSGMPANSGCRDWAHTCASTLSPLSRRCPPVCSIIGSMALLSRLVDAYVRGKRVVSDKIR